MQQKRGHRDSKHEKDLTHHCSLWRWKKEAARQEMRIVSQPPTNKEIGTSAPSKTVLSKSPMTCIFLNLKVNSQLSFYLILSASFDKVSHFLFLYLASRTSWSSFQCPLLMLPYLYNLSISEFLSFSLGLLLSIYTHFLIDLYQSYYFKHHYLI